MFFHHGAFMFVNKNNIISAFLSEQKPGQPIPVTPIKQGSNLNTQGLWLLLQERAYETTTGGLPDDRGIVPDYEVKPILSDILENVDADMEFAFKLISNKN